MQTSYGTVVAAHVCGCGGLPFKHGTLVVDDSAYHPVFSRRGVIKVAESLVEEEEVGEVKKHVCAALNLPEIHFFDITAEHLKPRDATPEEEKKAQKGKDLSGARAYDTDGANERAKFEMCGCEDKHGYLYHHEGHQLADVSFKEEALLELDRLIEEREIRLQDKTEVKNQILDSPLPDRDLQPAAPHDDSFNDPFDDDYDPFMSPAAARFEECENCGMHGKILDKNGGTLAEIGCKEDGYKAVDQLLAAKKITQDEEADIREAIEFSDMHDTREEVLRSRNDRIDAVMAGLMQLMTRQGARR